MIRSSGFSKSVQSAQVSAVLTPPISPLLDLEKDSENIARASKKGLSIGNADRPSNIWFRMNGQSTFWYQYALMDWLKREVSALSTLIRRPASEVLRYGLDLVPKFARKCVDCGYESRTIIKTCPICGGHRLRRPDPTQKNYFRRPNGLSFLEDANDNHMTLKDVVKMYAMSQFQNNQAYLGCIMGDEYDPVTGHLVSAQPLEFLCYDPKFVRYLYDETGKPGTMYAFTRKDRHTLVDITDGRVEDDDGQELYPASWQVGSSFGGTGRFWLYSDDEIYQDHWMAPSMTYGIPTWLDIEDDLLTWHFIEKHNLKKYKYGYVRKLMILPGFSDEDVERIVTGVQDVLATNDNSIPIVCTPAPMPNVAEMQAQLLELGTESSSDLLAVKAELLNRFCAHGGMPNVFAGDVEASGGMNNESQQITIFDRWLLEYYEYIDFMLKWIMRKFPRITDYELVNVRPSKMDTELKKRMDNIAYAERMAAMGYEHYYEDGEFFFSEEPMQQVQMREQMRMVREQAAAQQTDERTQGGDPDRGLAPGDGYGPPEKGTARREDPELAETKDEIDLSKREAAEAVAA